MPTSSTRKARAQAAAAAMTGLLLVGIATTPAHADSVRSQQWYLDAMGAEDIWKISTGKGVDVAVIDTGVDDTNGDLRGQVLDGLDLATGENGDEHTDYEGHGTGMAGIIAGTGDSGGGDGAFGLAPGTRVVPIRIPNIGWNANRDAEINVFNDAVSRAIRYAADQDIKVINISQKVIKGSQQLTDAVRYATNKGSLIFAGTGNGGGSGLGYPASTPGVVGVGALGKDLKKTDESQFGPQVDLSAPGKDIVHACGGKTGLCNSHGTSTATAIASATAALIWSKHPEWTNNQVLRVMLNTASAPTSGNKRNDYIGYGALRPLRALTSPGDPGPADEYPLPDLASSASPSPSAEPSEPTGGQEIGADEQPAPAASASQESSNTGLWIALGAGAAVLVGAAVAAVVLRARRNS
ncbi:type VII secretion-associated serine protease mycosin [Streptomyces sp. V4I23]|uniref:type VII secretion-associated serine protease mycosin n=1 Tax=Streptomyces sp. V4I23 TaxID=3042282 RepID=UPI002783131E|nr:type VII secretion-associated serine protease mycosin [Streptomyces sp. V4I23]MDQ1010494.1 type VII secretion-associated serine protease mycosin [Streptomyces sp. V4I23]